MTSCPLYNDSNLDSTGNKMNNPYALIQRAGRYKKLKKNNTKKRRKSYKKRIIRKNTKKVRFSKKIFF
jgi:hypothetical protein